MLFRSAIDDFLLGFIPPPGLSGDFNSNNEVDAGDYVIWRKKFGPGTLPNDAGISPGTIDAADYAHWRKRFGISAIPFAGSGSGNGSEFDSANVPEPSTISLLLLAAAAAGCLRRRKLCRDAVIIANRAVRDPACGEMRLADRVGRC